ncbi:MAG: TadE/TadG family type IV pilus assembly protein [Hyphomicrobiaceae bacterium]
MPMRGAYFDTAGLLVRFFRRSNTNGSIALTFAMVLPVLAAVTCATVDYAVMLRQKSVQQTATDTAAFVAAKEMSLSNSDRENQAAVIQEMVESYLTSNIADSERSGDLRFTTRISRDPLEVNVAVVQSPKTFFGNGLGLLNTEISTEATARVVGQPNICILALSSDIGGAITLEENAVIRGENCAVFSNSKHSDSIKSKKSSLLKASTICSSGGTEGGSSNFDPPPYTDCPMFDDPLASRPEPSVGACTQREKLVVESSRTLPPGTYCGGIEIKGSADVTLEPGIFVIKNGELAVNDEATLSGEGVGLFFTGSGAKMIFDRDTGISLSAPDTGAMAGLLIFGSRSLGDETFKILSNNARVLLGTVYLPTGQLYVETEQPVADQSAYTAIVAHTIHLIKKPRLVLNTDYSETTVPVPNGIKGAGQPIRLVM